MRIDLGWGPTLYRLIAKRMLGKCLDLGLVVDVLDLFIFLVWRLMRESRTRSCPAEGGCGRCGDFTVDSRHNCAALAGSAHWQGWKVSRQVS